MTALRINESSGSIGSLQVSDGYGGFLSGSLNVGSNLTLTNDLEGNFTFDVDLNQITNSLNFDVIGPAEDNTYEDGLFTDFTSSTKIGTAIDRFNEVLKGLAPSSAPSLDNLNSTTTNGATAKLSFGSSQSISDYSNVRPNSLTNPASNFSEVNINGTYSPSTSTDVRKGVYRKNIVITGILNSDVVADSPNYSAYAFGNGDQGTLKLFVNDNDNPIHTTILSSFGSGDSLNGNNSGFNLSVVTNGSFSNGTSFPTFKHRTGTYTVSVSDQREGWNFLRVVHEIGSNQTTTNYVEWVNDSNSEAITVAGQEFDSLIMTGDKYLSGVKYYTGGTAQYRIRANNVYKNIYSTTNNITFTSTNCTISGQSLPSINWPSENETKVLHVTGSATINASKLLNENISTSINIPHPFKSVSNQGQLSINGILLYNYADNSSDLNETFIGENYRMKSDNYNNQSDIANNSWDSTESLNSNNGMLVYNLGLRAPIQGINGGDFRNTLENGIIVYGPSSNVNYDSITANERTYYRKFKNTSGGSKSKFTLTINGSGTIVSHNTTYTTSNLKVFIKIPANDNFSTGWMDLAVAYQTGQTSDGNGCLEGSFNSSLSATNNGTFGTQFVDSNEYIIVAIKTDASFTGYLSGMTLSWR